MPFNGSPLSRRGVTGAVVAFLILLLVAVSDAAAQRPVRIPRNEVVRMVPDSMLQRPVTVIRRQGITQATVAANGLALEPGTFAVLRTGETVREVPGPLPPRDSVLPVPGPGVTEPFRTLPFLLLTPDRAGTGAWVLRPVYKVANRLRWEPDSGVFRGALFIAVEDSLRRGESRPLPTPVRFQLLAEADRVTPDQVALEHTNFPLLRIDLVARRVADSLRVHIVPEFDVRGTDVWVPVEPSLLIEAPRRIEGWGVGSARVIVRVIGASGHTPTAVALSASAGELDSVSFAIGSAASGTTRLRSGGTGPVTLTASAPGLNDAQATIHFNWPWIFFLAALLGGVFGGLAAAAQSKKGRRKTRWGEFALKGLFAGILAAVAWYALGVNLLHIDPGLPRFNELAVFAFAALAGYFGVPRMGGDRSEAPAKAT
ncbi:MAG: hypothetical protein ACREMQ_15290 [Longimicrobiales bacterium]